MNQTTEHLYRQAWLLSLFTIFYNVAEGITSMILGLEDETLALFGFGADSFIEVMSGTGIAIMILRIKQNPESQETKYEVRALQVTGTAYELTGFVYADVIGAAGLIYFSVTEGKEAFEKAREKENITAD